MDFIPITRIQRRIESSRSESDTALFYDLICYAELVVKYVALFLVSNLENDIDRTRYRYEYKLVRADGIGEFAQSIVEIITGSAADFLVQSVAETEKVELQSKKISGSWQETALNSLQDCLSYLNIDGNAVTSKSNLLIWFTNIALLRNKTKGHGSITASQCSQVCPSLEDSINSIANNLSVFQRSWAFLHQNLNGKYRVSLFSGSPTPFEALKKTTGHSFDNGVYCFTDRIRKVELCFSDENLSHFSLVNGNYADKYEILDYVTNTKNRVDGSMYEAPPMRLPNSVTSAREEMDIVDGVFSNLPQSLSDYIARKELEDELQRVLSYDDRYPIITLKGRGGIGKTSLAIFVIRKLINEIPNRFDAIVWFSARDVDLLPEGPKQVKADVVSQKDIATEFFKQVDPSKTKSKNIVELFSGELTKGSLGKTLYVFDNFETLSNPVEIFDWIDTYVRHPNKVLITSRMNRNFKADFPIEVPGMSDEECRNLIKCTATRLGIYDKLSESYISKLLDESDGHPYIIKVILGEAANTGNTISPMKVVASKDNVLDALFKRNYSTLSKAAKRVFLTLCSWRSVVPQIALEAVISQNTGERIDVEKAIEELYKSSFIDVYNRDDDSFIGVPMAAALFGQKELDLSVDKASIAKDKQLLVEFGAGTIRGEQTLLSHVRRKVKAIRSRIKNEADLSIEIPVLEYLSQKCDVVWMDIADLYHEFGEYEKEKESIKELIKKTSDELLLIACWKRLAQLAYNQANWKEESFAYMEMSDIKSVLYSDISYAVSRFNKYYSENSDKDVVLKGRVSEILRKSMERRITEADAVDCSRLSWLCILVSDETNALKYAKLGLELDPENSHCINLIHKLSTVSI